VADDYPDMTSTFVFFDCSDAQLQAFHREAVPILLPYHSELDSISWWCSQATLFYYSAGCLAGANAVALHKMGSSGHGNYPRGRDPDGEEAVIKHLFPSLLDFPINPAYGPICTQQGGGVVRHIDPANPEVVDWQNSTAFLKCKTVKEPYFISVIGEGEPQAPL